MKTEQDLIKSTICLMPWINISVDPNGEFRPCCLMYTKTSLKDENNNILNGADNSLEEVRNSHSLKKIRKAFINGEKLIYCKKCWDMEELNQLSKRISKIESYYKFTEDIFKYTKPDGEIQLDKFPLIWCDLRFGNLCNARCLICGSYNSSMFGENFSWMNNNRIIKDLKNCADHFKELYFTGGEPFINKYHWDLLDYLISKDLAKNIFLRYNTNGSVMKEKFIDKWSKFKRVQVGFSIDGIEETFEKIRTPLKWYKVKKNIILFDKLSNHYHNIESLFTPTISILNVFQIPELVNWFTEQKFKNISNKFGLNFVYIPNKYSIINEDIYDEVYQLYKPYFNSSFGHYYKTILQFINKDRYEANK